MRTRRRFTLIELVAVIVIMLVVMGLVAVRLRTDSRGAAFEQAVRDFQAFVARSRMQAMELGRDRVISYLPEERAFVAGDPAAAAELDTDSYIVREVPADYRVYDPGEEEQERSGDAAVAYLATLRWKLPAEYELGIGEEDLVNQEEPLEVFRFFADGSGSGTRTFTLQLRQMKRVLAISPVTGQLNVREEEVW